MPRLKNRDAKASGKGSWRLGKGQVEDGTVVVCKLVQIALDSAPIPREVRQVAGAVVRRSWGNYDYVLKGRSKRCSFSISSLAEDLEMHELDVRLSLDKLRAWRLVGTTRVELDPKPGKSFQYWIETSISAWTIPGFDAVRAQRVYESEQKRWLESNRERLGWHRGRPKTKKSSADVVTQAQAYLECLSGNPACFSPEALAFHRSFARMGSALGQPGQFKRASRDWVSDGNLLRGKLGAETLPPMASPIDIGSRACADLEEWVRSKYAIDYFLRKRQERLLEKKVRALFDIQEEDFMGSFKVILMRGLVLDWVWSQALHGFPSAVVVRTDSGKTLSEIWLGMTTDEVLAGKDTRKPALARLFRLMGRGATVTPFEPQKLRYVHRTSAGKTYVTRCGTEKRPGIVQPANAELRSVNQAGPKERKQLGVQLVATNLPTDIDTLSQLCTKHQHELLASVSHDTQPQAKERVPVVGCTQYGRNVTEDSSFLTHLTTTTTIAGAHSRGHHLLKMLVTATSQNPYKSASRAAHGGSIGEVSKTTSLSSIADTNKNTKPVENGVETRSSTGLSIEPESDASKVCLCAFSARLQTVSGPRAKLATTTNDPWLGTNLVLPSGRNATREQGNTSDNTGVLKNKTGHEIVLWTQGLEDPTPAELPSGMEYLAGFHGVLPLSAGSLPVQRTSHGDSEEILPGRKPAPGVLPSGETAAPPAILPGTEGEENPWRDFERLCSPSGKPLVGDPDPEFGLPPPLPDEAVLTVGARPPSATSQAFAALGLTGGSRWGNPPGGDAASGPPRALSDDREKFPSERGEFTTPRVLDFPAALARLDLHGLPDAEIDCPRCLSRHPKCEECANLVAIAAEFGIKFDPKDYPTRSVEELQAMSKEEWHRHIYTNIELPGPQHQDTEMGYKTGEDTFDMFCRIIQSFQDPVAEEVEYFFNSSFIDRWIKYYDAVPFYSTYEADGNRFRKFSEGLREHIKRVMSLVKSLHVDNPTRVIREVYDELYLTGRRRLRNQYGTLDTFVRLLTETISERYPDDLEQRAMPLLDLNDAGRSLSAAQVMNFGGMDKRALAELLVIQSGEIMVLKAHGGLRYVSDGGENTHPDYAGIPDEGVKDPATERFLLEVVCGRWGSLIPDPVRVALFARWIGGKIRYEHFKLIHRFFHVLRKLGYTVYDLLPDDVKLEQLPFLTNEVALRATLNRIESAGKPPK